MRLKLIAIVIAVGLVGCRAPSPDTPVVPVPPVVTLMKVTTQAAQADQTAAHLLKQLCQPLPPETPTLDSHTCSVTAVYLRKAASTFDKIILVANGPDEWPAIRAKVAFIAADAVTSMTVKDPKLQAALDSLQVLVAAILEVK